MTNCPHCRVNLVDRHCGCEEPVCYDCCSTRPAVPTCAYHFSIMGLSAQTTRAAAGLGPQQPQQAVQAPLPPQGGVAPLPSLPPSSPPPSGPAPLDLPTLSALITASIAAALQPQQAALAALHAEVNEMRAARPLPPSPPPPSLIPPPAALALGSVPSSPPAHRAAVLGGMAVDVNSLLRILTSPESSTFQEWKVNTEV